MFINIQTIHVNSKFVELETLAKIVKVNLSGINNVCLSVLLLKR